MWPAPVRKALGSGVPSPVDRRGGPAREPDVVFQHQNVIAGSCGNDLPGFDVRPCDGHLLPRHSDRLLDAEALFQPRIWLDVELIAQEICLIDVSRRCYGTAVASVHRCQPPRH